MPLSSSVSQALTAWLQHESWQSRHYYDMERFYKFVDMYQREYGSSVDDGSLREDIVRIVQEQHGYSPRPEKINGQELHDPVGSHIGILHNILEFLDHTGR